MVFFNLFTPSQSENDFLKELNLAQKTAVTASDQKICVIAGPGCGKTKTLVSRACYLIKFKNIKPHSLLLVTFTKKASKEMEERVNSLLGKITASKVLISGIHRFCYRVLRKYANSNLIRGLNVYDSSEQKTLIKTILTKDLNLAKGRFEKEIKEITRLINITKIVHFLDFATNPLPLELIEDLEISDLNIQVFKRYQKYLLENKVLDFNDILIETFKILKSDQELRVEISQKFSHIFIDEFQDINNLQLAIVELITGKNTNTFIVGDPNQSIYGFQGASWKEIQRIPTDKNWKTFYLNTNYRSTNQIIDVSNHFILKNKESLIENLLQSNDLNRSGESVKLELNIINFARVATRIKVIKFQKNYKFSDFAVLYSANYLSTRFEQELVDNQIPYEILGAYKFIEREEIKDVLAHLKSIVYQDDLSLTRIICLIDKIGERTVQWIEETSKEEEKKIFNFLSNYFGENRKELPTKNLNKTQRSNLDNFVNKFTQQIYLLLSKKKLSAFFKETLEILGYYQYLETKDLERTKNVDQLFNMLLNWEEKNSNFSNIREAAIEFLNYLTLTFDDTGLKDSKDNLTLSTIHKAKGLEFKVVFFVYLDEGTLPRKKIDDFPIFKKEEKSEEEKRMFYVGITRAREILYLVSSEKPSRFLESLSIIPSKELTFDFPDEVKENLEVLNYNQKLVPNNKEFLEKINFRVGSVVKIEKKFDRRYGKLYYSLVISLKSEDVLVYLFKSKIPENKWQLIDKFKKKDIIELTWIQQNDYLHVIDFNLVQSSKAIPWSNLKRKVEDLSLKKTKLAFIDVETTSQDVQDKVVEIGYVVCEWDNVIMRKNHFVFPKKLDFKKKVSFYNNITYKELKGSLCWEDLILTIQHDLKDCILISHNFKSTEYHYLKAGNYFQSEKTYYFIDTLDLAKEVLKEKKLASYGLEKLIRLIRNDQNFVEEHRALADALLHQELFFYLIKNLKDINLLYRIH